MKSKLLISILICLQWNLGKTQDYSNEWTIKDSLLFWSDVFSVSQVQKFRENAAMLFGEQIKSFLQNNPITESLPDFATRIAVLTSPSNEFRILTWQFETEPNFYKYKGIIQFGDGTVTEFTREDRNLSKLKYEDLDASNWYGAMYIHEFPAPSTDPNVHLMLGFARDPYGYKYKIIEPITIKNNQISFGKPLFKQTMADASNLLHRIVIKYSDEGSCSVEYFPDEQMLEFDHIASITERVSNAGNALLVPDGTYEGFKFNNNQWEYVERISNQILDKPPFDEKSKNASDSKDLFGRKKR